MGKSTPCLKIAFGKAGVGTIPIRNHSNHVCIAPHRFRSGTTSPITARFAPDRRRRRRHLSTASKATLPPPFHRCTVGEPDHNEQVRRTPPPHPLPQSPPSHPLHSPFFLARVCQAIAVTAAAAAATYTQTPVSIRLLQVHIPLLLSPLLLLPCC
jgi:hypothetical protein